MSVDHYRYERYQLSLPSFHIAKFITQDLDLFEELIDLFNISSTITPKMNLVEKTRKFMLRKNYDYRYSEYFELFLMNVEDIEFLEKNIENLTIIVFFKNRNENILNREYANNRELSSLNFKFYQSLCRKKNIILESYLIPLNYDMTKLDYVKYYKDTFHVTDTINIINCDKFYDCNVNHDFTPENTNNELLERLIGLIEYNLTINDNMTYVLK